MTKVSEKTQKQIVGKVNRTIKAFNFLEILFISESIVYKIEVCKADIREMIEANLEQYKFWFDQNYCQWEQDNYRGLSSEMAAQVWKEEWILQDYLNELTDSQILELERAERIAA